MFGSCDDCESGQIFGVPGLCFGLAATVKKTQNWRQPGLNMFWHCGDCEKRSNLGVHGLCFGLAATV